MAKISVFDPKVFGRKVATYAALGIVSVAVIGGVDRFRRYNRAMELTLNAERQKTEAYTAAIEQQTENERKVKEHKIKGLAALDDMIANGQAALAEEMAQNLSSTGFYTKQEVEKMNEAVVGVSEAGLYEQIKNRSAENTDNIAARYLEAYPDGPHRREALKELIMVKADELADAFGVQLPYQAVSKKLASLEAVLANYEESAIDVALPLQTLIDSGKDYASYCVSHPQLLAIGVRVKVIAAANHTNNGEWQSQYFTERQRSIPSGSVGEIIEIAQGTYIVQFPEISKWRWKGDWSPSEEYWTREKKNIAHYVACELAPFPEMNALEKQRFIERLESLKHYSQTEVEHGTN